MISKNNILKSGPRASLKLLMWSALSERLKTPALAAAVRRTTQRSNESYNADNQALCMGSRTSGIPCCRVAYSVACLPGTFQVPGVVCKIVVSECPSRATVRKNRSVEGLSVEITPVNPKRCVIYRNIM